MITKEDIIKNDFISTEEIEKDIEDTQREIDSMIIIVRELMKNPPENRLQIYLNEGGISKRQNFINDLNRILDYRNNVNMFD